MVFEVELELTIDEEDGAIVVQKMSELANRAKELGFAIVEATEQEEEEDEEERRKATNLRKRREIVVYIIHLQRSEAYFYSNCSNVLLSLVYSVIIRAHFRLFLSSLSTLKDSNVRRKVS